MGFLEAYMMAGTLRASQSGGSHVFDSSMCACVQLQRSRSALVLKIFSRQTCGKISNIKGKQ